MHKHIEQKQDTHTKYTKSVVFSTNIQFQNSDYTNK